MAIPSIMQTGHSGMQTAKAAIATAGHNIANANTEGFSRQRVITETNEPRTDGPGRSSMGTGSKVSRIERVNDEYIERQIRTSQRDMAHYEEKDLALRQIEDIFNEMNGDGLNRLISRFFNEFRRLSNEPENPAIRQSVREATQAMVNDFHRLRKEVDEVRQHLDARIEGSASEVNSLSQQIAELNQEIRSADLMAGPPNDLLDKRDVALKKLASFVDISVHHDDKGNLDVDMRGVGPHIYGAKFETLTTDRTAGDDRGKPEGAMDLRSTGSAQSEITHQITGGKIGALIEVRDRLISTVMARLDDLAFDLSTAVNNIHTQGVTSSGEREVLYFNSMTQRDRAAEFISLSDAIKSNINNIATAMIEDAPGDNRVAIAISKVQESKIMNEGRATLDDWYNSIVSDVGVVTARNRFALNQQRDISTQLGKMRDQISGVSIDEETSNLLQFQHVFDASAKVVQIADDMLKTVLSLKRD